MYSLPKMTVNCKYCQHVLIKKKRLIREDNIWKLPLTSLLGFPMIVNRFSFPQYKAHTDTKWTYCKWHNQYCKRCNIYEVIKMVKKPVELSKIVFPVCTLHSQSEGQVKGTIVISYNCIKKCFHTNVFHAYLLIHCLKFSI